MATQTNDTKMLEFEFINRLDMIKNITDDMSCSPYTLISAPMGYGKSSLLKKVRNTLQSSWLCIDNIELQRGIATPSTCSFEELTQLIWEHVREQFGENERSELPEDDIGLKVAAVLEKSLRENQDIKGFLLTIDNLDALSEDVITQFLDRFILKLSEGLHRINKALRLILVGRYVSQLKTISSEITLYPKILYPFAFESVEETVRYFSVNRSREEVEEMAFYVMRITGGHPGAIANILKDFPATSPPSSLLDKENFYYEKYLQPVIDEVNNHIPPELLDSLSTLSVVRRFESRFLQCLKNDHLLGWDSNIYELEDRLTQTYLVTREESGFLQNDITQRLLAIHMRRKEPQKFITLCQKAIAIYQKILEESKIFRLDIVALELFYQHVQYFCSLEEIRNTKKDVFDTLSNIPQELTQDDIFSTLIEAAQLLRAKREPRGIMLGFLGILRNDWEFEFTFNYLFKYWLRRDTVAPANLYAELLQKLNAFETVQEVKYG